MKNILIKEKTPLLIILFLYILSYIVSYAHWGDIIIDCGREVYVPYAITQGKVLYKDIFCIYGPFPYLFNAFFLKILPFKLNTYYAIGAMFGLSYILGVYLCARNFLSKLVSMAMCALVMYAVVLDNFIFNYILPYSYAIVFASVFSIWILYFLINYAKTKNANYLYYSAILWGGICASKIEFIPVIIPIAVLYLLLEKDKLRVFFKFVVYSLIIPFISYLVLFCQGLAISDLIKNAKYLAEMLNADTLKHFYGNFCVSGFNLEVFISNLKNTISLIFTGAIFFVLIFLALKRKKHALKYSLIVIVSLFYFAILMFQGIHPQIIFSMLPYICTIIFIAKLVRFIRGKEYKSIESIATLILFLFAIATSLKSYHSLQLGFYGTYSFAPLLICVILFLKELLEMEFIYSTKRQCDQAIFTFLIVLTLVFANIFALQIIKEDSSVKTKFGTVKMEKQNALALSEAISYLAEHSRKDDSLLVLPEGIMINYLTQKSWDFYQTSFIPLDFETFGEDNIIKEVTNKKPDFIMFIKRDTSEYGKEYICKDYGIKTCKYIAQYYSFEGAFGEKFRVFLFKQKDIEYDEEK